MQDRLLRSELINGGLKMSWFGFFHLVFGLGVLAKDAISDDIDDTRSREKAQKDGRATYLVNGYKMRSTKTGRDAYIDSGIKKTDHLVVRDSKTDRIIEDLTLQINRENQIKEKQKAKDKGSIFYRTTQFDGHNRSTNVYVSDSIPGYFEQRRYENDGEVYEEGDLVEAPDWQRRLYMVKVPISWREGRKCYYPDGSIRSIDVTEEQQARKADIHYMKFLKDQLEKGKMSQSRFDYAASKLVLEPRIVQTTKYYEKGEKFL